MTPCLDVTIAEAPSSAKAALGRLLQLYLHDFSEYAPLGSPFGEVGECGLFPYPPGLDAFWSEPGSMPLLLRADGRLAGFMLLNRWSALDRPLDRAVAEFFVLRKYRRAGVGTRAARQAFRRYPGRWEIPVADYNPAALAFWRAVVRADGIAATEHAGDGRRWSGTVVCLDSGIAARL